MDILFEAELRGVDPLDTLAERTSDANPPVREFTEELVRGVCAHSDEIDTRIADHLASGWTLDRLPRVDRTVLRIATFEVDNSDVPAEVVVSEAISLAEELSTDDSPAFVNGVLGSLINSR